MKCLFEQMSIGHLSRSHILKYHPILHIVRLLKFDLQKIILSYTPCVMSVGQMSVSNSSGNQIKDILVLQ